MNFGIFLIIKGKKNKKMLIMPKISVLFIEKHDNKQLFKKNYRNGS